VVAGPAPTLGQHTDEVRAEARTVEPRPVPTGPPPPALPPLAGVRILDLGSYLAGPFAPMVLADLGADVVKVEAPGGDAMRFNEAAFEGCQRGKRSVTVDLRDPDQRPRLEALVRAADVVHHNIRLPAARRLGVDADAIRAVDPDVVWSHVSSYGPRGERADWPGFDQMFQAQAGWEVASAGEGNPPQWLRFGMMDHHAALASAFATLLALYDRRRTGRTRAVSASLLGAAVLTTSETHRRADGTTAPIPVLDAEQTGVDVACRLYRAADGWIVVADRRPGREARLADAVGACDPRVVAAVVAERSTATVLAALARAGVPAEPVREDQRRAFLDSAANEECGLVVGYPHARYGRVRQVGALWDLDDLPLGIGRSAPVPGQHDAEVDADWLRPTVR
jgi:crotonobetainyl-CoA:carnitine CoA-transferase CaiB-like acyl-CoA transferase